MSKPWYGVEISAAATSKPALRRLVRLVDKMILGLCRSEKHGFPGSICVTEGIWNKAMDKLTPKELDGRTSGSRRKK